MVICASCLPPRHRRWVDAAWPVARWSSMGHGGAHPRSAKNGSIIGYCAIDFGDQGCRRCSGDSRCDCVFVEHLLGALGRFVTIRRLRVGLTSLRFPSILALQFLRGFISWFCFVLFFGATFGEALIASRGPKPDLLLYYLMVMPSVVVISAFWLTVNWYLSLAAILWP